MKKIKSLFLFIFVAVFAVTFLVSCGAKKYAVEFDTNGGVAIEAVSVKENETYTLPTPAKDGYQFEGWYASSDYAGDAVTTITVTEATKVYAKWAKLYTVTLNLNGGTASSSSVQLTEGTNVSGALANVTPTKGTTTFAGWYLENEAVASTYTMPANDITVEAKYKQTYTEAYYVENANGTFDLADSKTGSAFIGETINGSYSKTGYSKVTKDDSNSTVVISEDATQNVIKEYYARDIYTISFNTNTKEGTAVVTTSQVKGGEAITFPTLEARDGYQLAGWAKEDGTLVYKVNELDAKALNDHDEIDLENEDVLAEATTTYYAVWAKAYTNMFDGDDLIYLLDAQSGVAYLERAGYIFVGEYDEDFNSITFYDVNDDILIECQLNKDGTYCYANDIRAGLSYVYYSVVTGRNTKINLYLGQYNDVKYSDQDAVDVSKGTYTINEDNSFHIVYTQGNLAGTEMTVKFASVSGSTVFMVRNDEEYNTPGMYLYTVNGAVLDINPNYELVMDGYNSCTFGESTYAYWCHNEVIELYSLSNGKYSLAVTLKTIDVNGEVGVVQYIASAAKTYTAADGSTLVIDGMVNAKYTGALGEEVEGYYSYGTSYFSDKTIVCVTTEYGESYKFSLTSTTVDDVTTNSFVVLYEDYQEYIFVNADGAYYAPLLVIESETQASVYGFVSKGVFQLISTGTYKLNADGTYTYTATKFETVPDDVTVNTAIVDLTTVKSFVFGLFSNSSYDAQFWYSYTSKDDVVTSYVTEYVYTENEKAKITFVANQFVVTNNGTVTLTGTYSLSDGLYTLTSAEGDTMYLKINEEGKFYFVTSTMKVQRLDTTTSQADADTYLYRDETGAWTYNYKDGEEGKVVPGTLASTGEKSLTGFGIYVFTATDASLTVRFILVGSTTAYFILEDTTSAYTLTSEDGKQTLVTDGFNWACQYTVNGETNAYRYTVDKENNKITLTSTDVEIVLDVDFTANTFKTRGEEAGTYLAMDFNYMSGLFFVLDGYGKVKVATLESGEEVVIDANATYTIDSETGEITITYVSGADTVVLVGELSTYTSSTYVYKTFVVKHAEVATKLVNKKDWTVLILDAYGNATFYDSEGVALTGNYLLISDNLLYFATEDGSDASMFSYNKTTGALTRVKNSIHGYYTTDFDSLYFSAYGYAIFNNTTRYYYNVVDGEVFIYHKDVKNVNANKYGFVEENFGAFDDEKTYGGKTYYVNTGYAIEFNRTVENAEKYPVKLSSSSEAQLIKGLHFAPTAGEFAVTGAVMVGTTNYSCTVYAKYNEENVLERYFVIGNYRFDITIKFGGIDEETGESKSTYEITKMTYSMSLYHYTYLYYCYVYYSFFGMDYSSNPNEFGNVYLVTTYNEAGEALEDYITSDFTEKSGILDKDGNVINFNKGKYELTSQVADGTTTYFITAETVGADGYTYTFRMQVLTVTTTKSLMGVSVNYILRTQKFTSNGYNVTVTQIVHYNNTSSKSNTNYGSYIGKRNGVTVTYGEESLNIKTYLTDNKGNLYGIARTTDEDGTITATKYYQITLTEDTTVSDLALPYTGCTVTELAAKTYYSADKTVYVDVVDGMVKYISVDGNFVAYSSLAYNEETGVYTYYVVGDTETKYYELKITDGVVTLKEVAAPTDGE